MRPTIGWEPPGQKRPIMSWGCRGCSHCVPAFDSGAAVAFGLMGMAEAIGEREAAKHWAAVDASSDEAQRRHYDALDREAHAWQYADTDDRLASQ